jgi:RNA polymerase sigma factor (sigma-70 family)
MPSRNQQLLRDFADLRDAGDTEGAHRVWGELVEQNADLVLGYAAAFKTANGYLTPDEQADAAQDALVRIYRRLGKNLIGTHEGQFLKAMRTAARYACLDLLEDKISERKWIATSVEDVYPDDEGNVAGHSHPDLAAHLTEQELLREARARTNDNLYDAIAKLTNASYRLVVLHTLVGTPTEELLEIFGINRNLLYKWRERAYDELRTTLNEGGWEA